MTPRQIVEQVVNVAETKELWSAGYRKALPVTPQNFTMGGVLPIVLYIMRWGYRRGSGKFIETYRIEKGKKPTIANVATKLAQDTSHFEGFEGETEQAILGDMLLAFNLENRNHLPGRQEQVQRVYPTHYYSSWIDLPETSANLRNVPELIATLLTKTPFTSRGHYEPGVGFQNNLLLKVFGAGMSVKDNSFGSKVSDDFDEELQDIDQLLTIRLAKALSEPPLKLKGENSEIPSLFPVAQSAAKHFYEDFNLFLRAYGISIPRPSLIPMLESCLGVGTSNIFFSTLKLLLQWGDKHTIDGATEDPWGLFVDCSSSVELNLRRYSEDCMDDLARRLARLPVVMMCLQIMDTRAERRKLKDLPPLDTNPIPRINYLGSLILGSDRDAARIEDTLLEICSELATAIKEYSLSIANALDANLPHPAWRLAEAIVELMGDKMQFGQFRKFLDSCLMTNETNGLCRKRRVRLQRKLVDRRSILLSNPALDFLAHRHLVSGSKNLSSKSLSLAEFLDILRKRYGYYIDVAPPGFDIPAEMLLKNRSYFEQRLRDLGLLAGVNDAETMKRLKPRYEVKDAAAH